MAVDTRPLNELLSTIADSFVAAKDAFPDDTESFAPPADGISLLDVKNDLLLSYLQHLVFLILLRLKNGSTSSAESANLGTQVIKKLIELRAYLDRGVRPLEGRLRYQIDKVLRAAEDADRSTARKAQVNGVGQKKSKKARTTADNDSDISASGSGSEEDSDASPAEQDIDEEEANARPNPRAIAAAARARAAASAPTSQTKQTTGDGVYKPPRITPTAMPTLNRSRGEDADETRSARRRKNALLDEYINEEHSSAPTAQPSIGSNNTILARGRQHTSLASRDRDRERERLEYEERNFVRLPGASKAEKKKEKARQARENRDMFGGEDWTGLGGLGDRIERSVAGRDRNRTNVLERREKRKRDTQDLPRGDGVGIGESFEKRRRVVQGRADRKGGRRG
ncbi:hypothetical protein H2198_009058 [Neophaeococcomyces mojaviensis]|uniref:Uncharacterized protein n=1 Tax=Neophaeococcomyces mojaviensis TaxID=3383035 RepID=A0ACC2ZVP0_9EURO|nr:hypothetical protein H2198_009058 [Knufia sp. JES_112]